MVAAALFEAAANWLRARGRDEIMGPIDYSTNYVCGLLVEGFEFPPTLLTAHNPPYYAALIEGLGFDQGDGFLRLVVFRTGPRRDPSAPTRCLAQET